MIFSSELDEQHLQVIKESGFFQDIVKRCDSNAATGKSKNFKYIFFLYFPQKSAIKDLHFFFTFRNDR